MELEQKCTDLEFIVENDPYEESDKEFSDFFFELLSEQRY